MRTTTLFALFVTAIWTAWLWSGVYLVEGIIAQKEPGYPAASQIEFLIVIPLEVITLMVLAIGVAVISNRFLLILGVISGIALAGVLPYLFFYGGGV